MIWNYEVGRIYRTDDKGKVLSETNYSHKDNGIVEIERVYVAPELRGKGAAHETMTVVADYLRKEGLKATATCSYAQAWLQKNKEQYSDILA
ncbi:MAG: N-acetyltransferase [Clostridiales bacterium]|mgnify:CR=1 FL=1|jgi:predicted GNAT family acetyltransferase|nr:N-acetyltransferase [Clostridiales bacterium]